MKIDSFQEKIGMKNDTTESIANKGTIIFCIAFSVYLASQMFNASMFGIMNIGSLLIKIAKYGAYALMLWKIVVETRYSSGQVIRYIICAMEILAVYHFTGNKTLIFLFLIVIAMSDLKFSSILKTYMWTNGICMFAIILSRTFELIPTRNDFTETRSRYALGFDFVTTGANYWMYLVLAYICYRKKKLTLAEAIILEVITYVFFLFTDTKNAFAITTIAIVMAMVLKIWNGKFGRYIFSFFIKYITLIGAALISLLTFYYDKNTFVSETINELLTNRVSLTYDAVQKYGIKLFGQAIEWIGGGIFYEKEYVEYNYVDSSYMQILLSYGIVLLIVILVGYFLLGRIIVKEKAWYLGLVIALSAVHSTFDPQLLWVQYNVYLLALGYLLIPDKEKRQQLLFG